MIEQKMTCDERFIALAKELDYDIYGENTAGGHYAPLIRHHDEPVSYTHLRGPRDRG